jgi:hypothetical protein
MKKKSIYEYSDEIYEQVIKISKIIDPKGYVLFRKLVEKRTGYKIIKSSEELINDIKKVCESFLEQLNEELSQKTQSGAGWDMEAKFREYAKFRSPKGRGYPDNESDFMGELFYIECKACNSKNMNDTIRTFYFSNCSKIKQDAPHLLVSFEFEQTPNGKIWNGKYHVVDLFDKKMSIRMEINNNGFGNRDMYC